MAASPNSPAATPQVRRWIIFAALCSLIALALVAFFGVGRWLVVEDPIAKARAIVVLSGRMPVRALEAARLHAQGYAPEVWLTHSPEPGESLKAMGIPYEGEEVYSARVLIHEGVPAGAIHVLEPPIVNTADEVRVISGALGREKDRSVILVTGKPHTRRARLLWRKLAPASTVAAITMANIFTFGARSCVIDFAVIDLPISRRVDRSQAQAPW